MGGRSGKAKPEKRQKERRNPRTQGPHLTGALSEERRQRERRARAHDSVDLLVKTPLSPVSPYGWAHVSELRPGRFKLGEQLQQIGEDWKHAGWMRVAAVGREGFQMVVDLRPA